MPLVLETTLTRTMLSRCDKTPEAAAFCSRRDGTWVSTPYSEFLNRTLAIAAHFKKLGIESGQNVAVVAETSEEFVLTQWALWTLGAVVVPLSPQLSSLDLQSIIADAGAQTVIFQDQALTERVNLPMGRILNLRDLGGWLEQAATELAQVGSERLRQALWNAEGDRLFMLVYTSGTQGEPKGVMLSQKNIMSGLHDVADLFRPHFETEAETRLMVLPLSHIFGQFELATSFVFGSKIAFSERGGQSSEELQRELQEIQPTVIFGVPKLFEKILTSIQASLEAKPTPERKLTERLLEAARRVADSRENLERPSLTDTAEGLLARQTVIRSIQKQLGGKLKFAISGGAPLSADLGRELDLLGFRILEGYGLTETCGPITINDPVQPGFGTVGRPMTEVQLQFSSDAEILVRSPKNFLGYWQRPEDTAEVIKDGWVHTGDLGFLDSEGRLHITGRKKELIKLLNGRSVAPQKIENRARLSRYLEDCIVLGEGRNELAALVTVKREEVLKFCAERQILFSSFKELVEHPKVQALVQTELESINQELAPHEKIRRFVILPESLTVYAGVMTHTQKPRRQRIAERYKDQIEALYPAASASAIDPEESMG